LSLVGPVGVLLVALAEVLKLSSEVLDAPTEVSAGGHEIRRDSSFGGPSGEAASADAEGLRGVRRVDEVRHAAILAADSARSAADGVFGEIV
jgi:hypothetical protein